MQKLLTGFAFAAVVLLQAGTAGAQNVPKCSANDKPVMFDTKTHTYTVYPAATSTEQSQKNTAMAKSMMAANPNLKPMCHSTAVKMGGVQAKTAHMGGMNAVHSPAPTGPPAHMP
jgi:hypothetical protein